LVSIRFAGWKPIAVVGAFVLCAGVVTIVLIATTGADVTGETPQERVTAVNRVAARRPRGAARALARAVEDRSPEVRRAAMAGLAHVLEPEHRPVVEKGTRDSDGKVRALAADTLGVYGDHEAADVLVRLIENDPEPQVRIAAIRGLAKCKDPRSIAILLETADKGPSTSIKLEAMRFLSWKFKANVRVMRDPRNQASWRDLIQRWKWDLRVRDAYAAAGVPLIDRPQDILGKDWHPARRDYTNPPGRTKTDDGGRTGGTDE
jgi:HEAT repeat protein